MKAPDSNNSVIPSQSADLMDAIAARPLKYAPNAKVGTAAIMAIGEAQHGHSSVSHPTAE